MPFTPGFSKAPTQSDHPGGTYLYEGPPDPLDFMEP
jgi:hypothetical protein